MTLENLEKILYPIRNLGRYAMYATLIAAIGCPGNTGSGTPTNTAPNTPANNTPYTPPVPNQPTTPTPTAPTTPTPPPYNPPPVPTNPTPAPTPPYIPPQNTAPVINTASLPDATQDKTYLANISATDQDNDSLTYELTKKPASMSIDSQTGQITWTPRNADVGKITLEARVSDGKTTVTKQYQLNVANVNDVPEINTSTLPSATQDQPYSATISATDPDNDSLTYEIISGPSWLKINTKTGQLSGTPRNADVTSVSSPATLEAKVSDGKTFAAKQYPLTVINANDAPQVQNIPQLNAILGQAFEYQLIATDLDSDPLIYNVVSPSWLTADSDGKLSGTPTSIPSNFGKDNLEVRISDGKSTVTKTSVINVLRPNSPPVIQTTTLPDTMQGSYYQVKIFASDAELDKLAYSMTQRPSWMYIQSGFADYCILSGTPTNADVGANNVEVTVTDGKASTSKSFTLNVINTNDAPEINSVSLPDAVSNQLYQAVIDATDLDNEPLTYRLLVRPAWLDITPNTGLISGTPTPANTGNNKLIVIVSDGKESRAKELSINVDTNTQPNYSVSLPPNGFLGEYRCYSNDHHFLTLLNHTGEFAIRSHPGKDINGWGTTLYLMPFFPGTVLTGATLDSIVHDSTGVSVNASGKVSAGSSSSYGTWAASMRFDYAATEKKVTGTGDYTITLADSVSSLSKGDLNLIKIATNYLRQVPKLSLSGSIGDTGDMDNVDVVGDNFSFTWEPTQQPAHFPQDITDTLSMDVHGEYNDVDTVTMGRARIEPAYKPNVKIVLRSKIPGQKMIYGAIYDTSKATMFWEDNIGITPLILGSSIAKNFEYKIDFESTALPGDK